MNDDDIKIVIKQKGTIPVYTKTAVGSGKVIHDETLEGAGNASSPLKIADSIIEEIHNAGKVDDVLVNGVSVVSNKIAEIDLTGKVDKTDQADKVYGTNAQGEQTTYDVDSFGQVDDVKVNGTSVVENKVANVSVPTAVSQLTNDANYQTGAQVDSAIQYSILDSVQSTSTTHSLSANKGKELQDEIDNLKARGRFLALWNCATGLAESNPPESPYIYQTGDYFIVGIVDTTDPVVNYRPDGSSYTTGVASQVVETAEVAVDDVYYYDGTNWKLQSNTQKTVAFANIAGQPYDNSNLASALNDKQDKLTSLNAGANITITPGSDVVIPDLYQTVEYIECNGTQWFDTGFVPEGGMIADVKGRPAGGSFWFGSIMPRPTNPNASRNLIAYVGGNYLPQKVSVFGNSYQKSANEDAEIHLDTRGTRFYATIDNHTVYDLSNTASLTDQTASVKLCYEEYTETISGGRFYSFKIYDSTNTLAVNLIPCYRKTDNVGGFYDAVSGAFLVNQGTGSVIVGPNAPSASDMIISAVDTTYSAGNGLTLSGTTFSVNTVDNLTSTSTTNPLSANQGKVLKDSLDTLDAKVDTKQDLLNSSNAGANILISSHTAPELPTGYTALDYIRMEGAQMISLPGTVLNVGSDYTLEYRFNQLNVQGVSPHLINPYNKGVWFGQLSTGLYTVRTYNGTNAIARTEHTNTFIDYKIVKSGTNYVLFFNNDAVGTGTITDDVYDPSRNTLLFSDYTNYATGLISYLKFNDDVYLVAAKRDSDGIAGLYDVVNNIFYTSSTATNFIAGPEAQSGVTISAIDTTYSAGTGLSLTGTTFSANLNNTLTSTSTTSALTAAQGKVLNDTKQATLVSGTNIKTINNESLLGSGNITIDPLPDQTGQSGKYLTTNGTSASWDRIEVSDVYGLQDDLDAKQDVLTSANAGENITITTAGDKRDLPTGYQQVAYLQSSGTQYIDTGFKPNSDTKVEIKTQKAINNGFVFGARNQQLNESYLFVGASNSSKYRSDYGSSQVLFNDVATQSTPFTVVKDKNVCTLNLSDGTIYTVTNTVSTFASTYNMFLFACNTAGTADYGTTDIVLTRIYYCKIYDDGTLVADLVPAKRESDDVLGMYDLVSDTFITNAGTGVFIAGSDVLSDVLISATDTTYTAGSGLSLTGTTFSVNTINNTTSTSTTNPLSANMGKSLQDQIDNLKARGRFLALWDCSTGLAESNPPESPYTYQSGDYFIVGTVASAGATNYRPTGSTYTTGVASTVVETEAVDVDDVYYYDGTNWKLQINTQKTVAFANIAGDPYDNTNLGAALDNKQSKLTSANAGPNIDIVNSGTVPDLPTGYTPLYYIQNVDGDQWIDTGIGWTSANTKVDLTWGYFGSSSTSGIKAIIGSSNPNGDSNWWGAYSGNSNSYYWSVGAGNAFTSNTFARGEVQNVIMETKNDNTCTQVIDGGIASSGTWSGSFINQGNIFLFRYSYANILHNTGYTRIYRVKLYQDDVLIRDLTPAKRSSDNAIGMYDLVNDVFYANGGTGSFIAGPELEPGSDLVIISAEDTTYSAGTGLILNNTTFSANLTNNLTSTSTSSALTANMGKYLNDHKQDLVDEYTAQEVETLWGSI